MKIKTNGIELNYTVEGNGPWLVMSHSLACDLTMWDEQAAVLRRNFKVLRFDTRGHGASDAPEGEYTLDMMAYDVHGLLQALSVERCHWVGLSLGGMIGQTFALKFPAMFASMVLADTTRDSQDQPDPAAEGCEVPVARDRRRAGRGHPGRDGARDPRRAARIRSGGHPLGLALVQPRAARGVQSRSCDVSEQAPVDHPGAS